jgi:uncharacterized protein YegP (UPF0339 family)
LLVFKPLSILILILITAPEVVAQNEVYKSIDKNGVTVFSDSPKSNSKAIVIPKPTIIKAAAEVVILSTSPQIEESSYQIDITQPSNHDTIRNNNGTVNITVQFTPLLTSDLDISLLLDGKTYLTAKNLTRFNLKNIERGEHEIKFELKDDKGKIIASSTPVTFYMHRTSVINAK